MTPESKKPTADHHANESGTHEAESGAQEALGVPSYAYLSRLVTERAHEGHLIAAFEDFNAEIRLLRYVEKKGAAAIESLQAQLAVAHRELAAAQEEAAYAAVAKRESAAAHQEAAAARQDAIAARQDAVSAWREAAAAQGRTAAAEATIAELETLQALYRSTSWRVTRPMRGIMRLLRRRSEARARGVAVTFTALWQKAKTRGVGGVAKAVYKEGTRVVRRLTKNSYLRQTTGFIHVGVNLGCGAGVASFYYKRYEAATRLIQERYLPASSGPRPVPLHVLLGSEAIVRRRLSSVLRRRDISPSSVTPRYSIVTPYFAHAAEFRFCAESIAALFAADGNYKSDSRIEWIVVNDDPDCSKESLWAVIPASLAVHTRILSDDRHHGIAESLNRGIRAAKHEWIALIDCDDMIEPHALRVLDREITGSPNCRYFSSCIIDIDENGRELRRRRHEHPPEALFEAGMVMGHLKVFRRELFEELGGFNTRFTGVQDYDFALRAAASEKLHQIPDHLYRYRWHSSTQSSARAARQEQLAEATRASFLRKLLVGEPLAPLISDPLPEHIRGFCVIRTQGARMELLEAAIASVQSQSIPMTACVAVHGPATTRDFVDQWLRRRDFFDHSAPPIVVAACAPGRRRGYPCNIALDELYARPYDFDVFCFLDDDDHFLPNFTSTLLNQMRLSQADMAFGLTNALPTTGEPVVQHSLRPAAALFHHNFMPINSYLCRTPALLAAKVRFDEKLDYLEDWDFLVQLMAAGIKAVPAFATVSEYRLVGDGNVLERRDPEHYMHCHATVRERGARAVSVFSKSRFWNDVLDFPSDRTLPFSSEVIDRLKAALDLFAQKSQ
jgi:GT2 family glycosyltransferase